MEILLKAAREYRARMLSRFEFRSRVAEAVNTTFNVEDVEKLVSLLLQNAMAE
jgi:hydroxyacyl-ACP dehydratase HTD2-like protein with hotdog domain